MKPVIGITVRKETDKGTTFLKVDANNTNAIVLSGGIPFMMALTDNEDVIDEYINMVDGIYFTGGNDISPETYGEEVTELVGTLVAERDEFEIKLYKKAEECDMPMLGVCRGHQIMNVASGGTLYQDIYAQRSNTIGHSPEKSMGENNTHTVRISEESKLHSALNTNMLATNSIHHQAVKDVAGGYKISAVAEDGIIEGIESEKLTFALGVQWHPEDMFELCSESKMIYKALIDAAVMYKKGKIKKGKK